MSIQYQIVREPDSRWVAISYGALNVRVNCEGVVLGERGWPLKTELNAKGYPTIKVGKMVNGNKFSHRFFVHRLVASAFIPNPNNLPQVNHIDGNKQNNHYTNLEWCDQSYNVLHSYRVLHKKTPEDYLKKKRYGRFLKLLPVGDYKLKITPPTGLKVSATLLTQRTDRGYMIIHNGGESPMVRVYNKQQPND